MTNDKLSLYYDIYERFGYRCDADEELAYVLPGIYVPFSLVRSVRGWSIVDSDYYRLICGNIKVVEYSCPNPFKYLSNTPLVNGHAVIGGVPTAITEPIWEDSRIVGYEINKKLLKRAG